MSDDPQRKDPSTDEFDPVRDDSYAYPPGVEHGAGEEHFEDSWYEPPGGIVTDEAATTAATLAGPLASNRLLLLAVAVLVVLVLALAIRACGAGARPAEPLPAPATTEESGVIAATFTPTPDGEAPIGQTPAAPTEAIPPTSVPDPATATPTSARFQAGMRVQVTGTGAAGMRFRTGPGLNYITAAILPDQTELIVVGGPEQADGITWWRLQTAEGAVGWGADEILTPVSEGG